MIHSKTILALALPFAYFLYVLFIVVKNLFDTDNSPSVLWLYVPWAFILPETIFIKVFYASDVILILSLVTSVVINLSLLYIVGRVFGKILPKFNYGNRG